MNPSRSFARRRTGATLLDVATGSMLLAVLLIPSVHLIGESRSSNRRLQARDAILFEADQLVETAKASLSDPSVFDQVYARPLDRTQAVAASDVPNLMGRIRISADGTITTQRILTINVQVWQDKNRSGSPDADEPGETLRTQWAEPS